MVKKIFRFSINNGVFNYDNYFINFVTFCNLQQGGNESVRGELEAIRLSNGNIRLGRAGVFYHFSEPAKTGVITIDANSSGTFIANSYKFCDYLPNSFSITPNQTTFGAFLFSVRSLWSKASILRKNACNSV